MAELVAVAGSKIYIGRKVARKTNIVLADFSGATWTEIGGWTNMGAIGVTQNWVSQSFINDNFDAQVKGTSAGATMENTFSPDPNDAGQILLRAAQLDCSNYEFKVEFGAGCAPTGVATITIASPGLVTVAGGHGLSIGSPVSFSTTGALPTGLTAGTTYYVLSSGYTVSTFQLALTPGGTAIITTGTQSGVHTYTGLPAGQTKLFRGMAGYGSTNGGEANTAQLEGFPIAINSIVLTV